MIHGDATDEDILMQAGIKEAKGLVSTLGNDAENVFTVLTAREINKNLQIVARAIEPSAAQKLRKAGADSTINRMNWEGTAWRSLCSVHRSSLSLMPSPVLGKIHLIWEKLK